MAALVASIPCHVSAFPVRETASSFLVPECPVAAVDGRQVVFDRSKGQAKRIFSRFGSIQPLDVSFRRKYPGRFSQRSETVKQRRGTVTVNVNGPKTDNASSETGFQAVGEKQVLLKKPGWKLPKLPFIPRNLPFFSIAAGMLVAAAAVQATGAFLNAVNAIPLFEQVEILIGTAFSVNIAGKFFGGGDGRARLESLFEDIKDRIQGVHGLSSDLNDEPSMLDVQLRSLVDEYLQMRELKDSYGEASAVSVVTNKASLIVSIRDFVNERELKSRRINAVLRKDITEEKASTKKLSKLLEERTVVATEQEAELEKLMGVTNTLQGEKESALSSVELITSRLDAISRKLESMSLERDSLQQLNHQLQIRTMESETESLAVRDHLLNMEHRSSVPPLAVEAANVRRVEEVLLQRKKVEEENESASKEQKTLEIALEKAEMKLNNAMETVTSLEEHLLVVASTVKDRDGQVKKLQYSLTEMRLEKVKAESYVQQLQKELETAKSQVVEMKSISETEIEAMLNMERKRRTVKTEQLEQQLAMMQLEKDAAFSQIEQLKNTIDQQSRSMSVSNWKSVEKPKALQKQISPKKSIPVALKSSPSRLSPAQSIASLEVELQMEERKELVNVLLSRELQAYVRSVRAQYVDLSRPVKEQEKEVEALVKEIVAKGGSEAAARKYVKNSIYRERYELNKKQAGIGRDERSK